MRGALVAIVAFAALASASVARADVVEVGRAAWLGEAFAVDGQRVIVAGAESVLVFGDPAWSRADALLGDGHADDLQLAAGDGMVAAARWNDETSPVESVLVAGRAGGPFRVLERCRGDAAHGPPLEEYGPPPPAVGGQTVAWLACGKRFDRVLVVDGAARRVIRPGAWVRSIALAGRTLALGVVPDGPRARTTVLLIDLDGRIAERRVALPGHPSDVGLAGQDDGTVAVAAGSSGEGILCPRTRVSVIPAGTAALQVLGLNGCGPRIAIGDGRIVTVRGERDVEGEPDLVVMPVDGGAATVIDRGNDVFTESRAAIEDGRVVWVHQGCTGSAVLSAPLEALPPDQRKLCSVQVVGARLGRAGRLAVRVSCERGCAAGAVVADVRRRSHQPSGRLTLRRPGVQTLHMRLPRAVAARLRRARRPRLRFLYELALPGTDAYFHSTRVAVEIGGRR